LAEFLKEVKLIFLGQTLINILQVWITGKALAIENINQTNWQIDSLIFVVVFVGQ